MFNSNGFLPSGICARDQLNHCHVAVTSQLTMVSRNAQKAATVFKKWGPKNGPRVLLRSYWRSHFADRFSVPVLTEMFPIFCFEGRWI